MCGIFAYVGQENATNIVFTGLKDLEYRGYDSWGMAAVVGASVKLEKHVGKIGSAKSSLPASHLALGHTRWATHGGVTKINTHPHTNCREEIFVVHNGIIDNYEELKAALLNQGHTFVSETDTEVFAHLIEELHKVMSFKLAVRQAFRQLEGLNTTVALDVKTKTLVAYKNGSPLIIGIDKDGGYYLSSDLPSLHAYANSLAILEDGEGILLNDSHAELISTTGKKKTIPFKKYLLASGTSEKGNFAHYLQKEIYDQPTSLARISSHSESLVFTARILAKAKKIYLVACGTAHYATLAGSYMLAGLAGLQTIPIVASEFKCFGRLLTKDDVVVAASQSGETIDTLEAIRFAKKSGATTLSLVNVEGSTLSREADLTIPLLAGTEKAVLSTKAFTSKLAVFFLLSHLLINKERVGEKKLLLASRLVKTMLAGDLEQQLQKLALSLAKSENLYVVGRGLNYPIALEGALKIKEVTYIHAEGFAGGELKHGVIALIEKGTPCIVIVSRDEEQTDMLSGAMELKARGARIIGISPDTHSAFDDWIKVPDEPELSPFLNIIPLQLLAYHIALVRGLDPDKPRNLAKSVTVK